MPKVFIVILVTFAKFGGTFDIGTTQSPRKRLNFTDLVSAFGHRSDTYQTITEDGYILTLFNIPGNRSRPVLIMHGALSSADSFVIRGNGSLGCALADDGYDVWFGNYRGNYYSRSHINLDADNNAEFWNFTFHEMGYYDLPANIDFILNNTGQTELSAIGHSQGTTIFYVLGCTRPEYNEKIKILISLAPIAFLKHVGPPVSTLIEMESVISRITQNKPELIVRNSKGSVLAPFCNRPSGYKICKKFLFSFSGADEEEMDVDFLSILRERYPSSISRKLAQHLSQLRKTFAQYDYGAVKNMQVYNSTVPPAYNLKNCTMKIALFVGKNDRLSVVQDVELLREQLPNVVEYRVMERDLFNHLDFVWGKNMLVHLFPFIFETLKKYS